MSHLLASIYDGQYRAADVLAALRRNSGERVPDIEHAAVVTKGDDSQLKLEQTTLLTGLAESLGRGVWPPLFRTLLFGRGTLDDAGDAGAETVRDYGFEAEFVSWMQSELWPDSSALFLLERLGSRDETTELVSSYGGMVMTTALAPNLDADSRGSA